VVIKEPIFKMQSSGKVKWPLFLLMLGYALIAISFLGFGFAAVEGVRANYIKTYSPKPTLPHDRLPTEEELKLHRLESRKVDVPYALAKERANIGLLIGFPAAVLGIALGIFAGKAGTKRGYF
jgi:hypothetical protein